MIIQGLCTSAKEEFFKGIHKPEDLYMLALYNDKATLNPSTTVYTPQDEVTGGGYSAGGLALKGYTVGSVSGQAYLTWSEPVIWYNCTVSTVGGIVYNRSKGNKAIIVVDFGDTIPAKNGVISVSMPPKGASALIIWG